MHQVLVVEDYADLRSAITASFPADYSCTCVRSSEDAVEEMKRNRYEVILLSPRLPIKDDPLMHFLHEQQPDELPKVILMTHPGDDAAGEVCGVLVKPFNREELLAELARH